MAENRAIIGQGGRILIPAYYRKKLGLKPGDEVLLILDEGEVRVVTIRQAIERAQALVRQYVPAGHSLVDELLAERRDQIARGVKAAKIGQADL